MEIALPLANQVLKGIFSTHLRVAQLPENLPFSLPVPAKAEIIASVESGDRTYEILLSAPTDATAIRAFYLNHLRLSDWLVRSSDSSCPEDYGLRLHNRPLRSLQLFHPLYELTLSLEFVEEDENKQSFLIAVKDVAAQREAYYQELSDTINWTPVPLLFSPPSSTCRLGNGGGSEAHSEEFRMLENAPAVLETFEFYRSQIDSLSWQLQESRIEDSIAYGRWTVTNGKRQDWQLVLCVARTQIENSHTMMLWVDRLPMSAHLSCAEECSSEAVSTEMVEHLLKVKQTESRLYTRELPAHLQDVLLPPNAAVIAVVENEQPQRRFFLDIEGTAQTVYRQIGTHFESLGWACVVSPPDEDIPGFKDSGFHALMPSFYCRDDEPYNRLRLWTKPATKGTVRVELLFDRDPERSFQARGAFSGYISQSSYALPILNLTPMPNTTTYQSGGGGGPDNFTAAAFVLNVEDSGALMDYYGQQLADAGWQMLASPVAETIVKMSSWGLEDEAGNQWRGLLWTTPDKPKNCQWVVRFKALTEAYC